MGYRYEVNGRMVEFERKPTDADIDEAAASFSERGSASDSMPSGAISYGADIGGKIADAWNNDVSPQALRSFVSGTGFEHGAINPESIRSGRDIAESSYGISNLPEVPRQIIGEAVSASPGASMLYDQAVGGAADSATDPKQLLLSLLGFAPGAGRLGSSVGRLAGQVSDDAPTLKQLLGGVRKPSADFPVTTNSRGIATAEQYPTPAEAARIKLELDRQKIPLSLKERLAKGSAKIESDRLKAELKTSIESEKKLKIPLLEKSTQDVAERGADIAKDGYFRAWDDIKTRYGASAKNRGLDKIVVSPSDELEMLESAAKEVGLNTTGKQIAGLRDPNGPEVAGVQRIQELRNMLNATPETIKINDPVLGTTYKTASHPVSPRSLQQVDEFSQSMRQSYGRPAGNEDRFRASFDSKLKGKYKDLGELKQEFSPEYKELNALRQKIDPFNAAGDNNITKIFDFFKRVGKGKAEADDLRVLNIMERRISKELVAELKNNSKSYDEFAETLKKINEKYSGQISKVNSELGDVSRDASGKINEINSQKSGIQRLLTEARLKKEMAEAPQGNAFIGKAGKAATRAALRFADGYGILRILKDLF